MTFFSTGFDPYRKWLGIPENRRPPTYYSILGITRGENDDDVIRSAAQQRRAFIQGKRGEGHDKEVAKILREIDESVACLLVPTSKNEYDRQIGFTGKKNGKQKNHPLPTWFDYFPVRIYGEGSGIISSVAGIMAVICLAIGGMVWFSFQMPWEKLTNPENQTGMLSSLPLGEKIIPLRNEAPAPSSESIVAITPLPATEAPTEPSPVEHPVVELQKPSPQVWLNTMPVINKYDIVGWTSTNGEALLEGHSGKPLSRTKLKFDGTPSPNGIYQHATGQDRKASVTFLIGNKFKRLETVAFIPSAFPQQGNPLSPIVFDIVGDGRSLWKSDPLARKGDKQSCSVSVQDIDHLTFQVNALGKNNWGLAAWHDAKLFSSDSRVDAQSPQSILAKMQGEWLTTSADEIGQSLTMNDVKQQQRRFTFNGNRLTMRRFTNDTWGEYNGEFKIDESNSHFDFSGKGPMGNPVKWLGVVSCDDKSLKLCYRYDRDGLAKRTTLFVTDGNRHDISVLYRTERVK